MKPVFGEIQKKKLIQTLAVYGGSGWLIIEVLDFLVHRYQWSELILDLSLILIIMGLPAVLIFTYNHTSGKNRTSKIEISLYALIFLLTAYFSFNIFTSQDQSSDFGAINSQNSIAILPLKNITKNEENQYFADGVTEAIRSYLGKVGTLEVRSQNTMERYRASLKSIPEIAREVNATYILEGSFQIYGKEIRVDIRLIDASADKQIWTENYLELFDDVLDLQSKIALDIVNQLNIQLDFNTENNIERKYTENVEAYNHYLQGIYILKNPKGTLEEMNDALLHFENALELDDKFSLAYVGVAEVYLYMVYWARMTAKDAVPKVRSAVLKAIELDNKLGEAYAALGVSYFYELKFEMAESYLLKAVELNPDYAEAYHWLGLVSFPTQPIEVSFAYIDKAIKLEPFLERYQTAKAGFYHMIENYDSARILMERVLEKTEDDYTKWQLANTYFGLEEYEKGLDLLKDRSVGNISDEESSNSITTNWTAGYAYAKMGNEKEARRILNYQLSKEYVPGYMIAVIYIGLQNYDSAMYYLWDEYQVGLTYVHIAGIVNDPKLNPLEDHPGFSEYLDTLGVSRK